MLDRGPGRRASGDPMPRVVGPPAGGSSARGPRRLPAPRAGAAPGRPVHRPAGRRSPIAPVLVLPARPGAAGAARRVPWSVMAAAFFAAELKVVDVHFRREKHSFSLSEFPAVIGFFLLSPGDYFLAMLLGTGAALLVLRQPPLKFAFNLANFAFTAAAALSVFYLLRRTDGVAGRGRLAGRVRRDTCAAVLSAFTIATAISLSGGAPQFQKLPEMIQFGGLVAVANTSLALLAVSILWLDPLPARGCSSCRSDGVPRLSRLRLGAREARTARAAVSVGPDPPALAGARLRARRPARARPRDVPRGARGGRAVATRRDRRGRPADASASTTGEP